MERHPVRLGFLIAVGVLLAVGLAVALSSLSTVLITIGTALFVAVGLNPLIGKLVKAGVSRSIAVLIVALGMVAVLATLIWVLTPIIIEQIELLFTDLPSLL
ncbi:MAG: AI-2E family transporter, partial [Mycetocola sp.]